MGSKNVVLEPIDIHCMDQNILQNILFCVSQQKESLTSLEQQECEQVMTDFQFLLNYSFNANDQQIQLIISGFLACYGSTALTDTNN